MKSSLKSITLSLVLLLPGLAIAAPASDAIVGIWLNADKEGYIQIYQTDEGTYAGQIVGATDGKVRADTHNPNPAQRDEPLLGKEIMHGFEYNGEGRWVEGRVYDPEKGETYDAWLALKDQHHLKVHGYIFISLIGRTEIWTRTDNQVPEVRESVLEPTPADLGNEDQNVNGSTLEPAQDGSNDSDNPLLQ